MQTGRDVQIVLIKGIANFRAVKAGFEEKGYDVKVIKYNLEEIAAVTAQRPSVLICFFFDNTILKLTRHINCPVVSWLSDKINVKNVDGSAGDMSRFFVFSMDPADVEGFRQKGINARLLPCNSGLDPMNLPDITDEEREKYGCDVSFVGESMTIKHNPYFQFILNFSNLVKHMDDVINAQAAGFTKNILTKTYEQGDLKKFSSRHIVEYVKLLDDRDLDFALGCEASGRIRKRLLSLLSPAFKVKVFGDDHWRQIEIGFLKAHPATDYWTETPKVYKLSKVNLNISKTFFAGTVQRVFDIVYCGGFCLTDYRDDVNKWFEPGKEIETYSDENEFVEKVRYYLEHENERKDIQERGHKRLLNEHRVGQRIDTVMESIK
jgi:spore maturation protein CgeB